MATGLYKLIGGGRNGELYSTNLAAILESNGFSQRDRQRLLGWLNELAFWEEYADIYFNLEKAKAYDNLSDSIKRMLKPRRGDVWLDIGCGPLRVSELIYKKENGVRAIEAVDIILKPAREKLAKLAEKGITLPVNLKYASITDRLPYPDNFFDGIGANLILPYVIDFLGKTGKAALEGVLREMFRILKPGGHMVWSSPKHNVQFAWVFLASIPDMLNLYEYIAKKDITRILQGVKILKHALAIQSKGKKGIYTFLLRDELESLLQRVGFVDPVWEKTFTQQVWVNRVYKP
jgi:SAM-dependent methyltransferase